MYRLSWAKQSNSTFYRSMSTVKVLRFGPIRYAQEAWQKLEQRPNVEVVESGASSRAEFLKELDEGKFKDVNVIARTFESVKQTGLLDKELLALLKEKTSLQAISHNGAGYDQVDAVECGRLGIQVSNVPSLVDAATADTHIYLLLGALRNFQDSTLRMLQGKWPSEKCAGTPVGHDPEGKVLGIYGMGGIGRAVRDRAKPFGFRKILYHNRNRLAPELEQGAEYVSMDELLSQADVISINIPLNDATRHSINKDTIAKMKDGVVIVNTARGPIVDESALLPALKSGKVGAFGSDVFENEPNVNMELIRQPNVVSLPHMGTHTVETMKAMEEFVVQNVAAFVDQGKVLSIVPELKGKF
ncbi:hypothetical protein KL912_001478 [Ogataea haglerorum]|nr:hypothetical protein KL912_001478 [Ogataea haglerorum]KAG7775164.1 hypothetical protein KL922_004412 [Ogataea haglerorum]KAG7792695.1 hypothetical protein KL910_000935 [Ogataea haglerorum]KAG7793091.1 hypothetical protein KL945_000196 [Ogataea haglerorum]